MEKTQKLLRDEGAEFQHAYSTTPMCCPSRSSLLTGLYTHNHEVFTNNDNCSGPVWQSVHESRTFATYLTNEAGYHTGTYSQVLYLRVIISKRNQKTHEYRIIIDNIL